jgi:SAM-dependent methyltransferase
VVGTAEATSCPDRSVDGALLFFVWHHVTSQPDAARELHRITRPGGTLLVRTQLADRMPELWWYEHSPRAREIDTSMYETLADLRSHFEHAGWELVDVTAVRYEVTPSRRAYVDRLRLRAISTFEHMSDAEADDLLERLENAVADDDGSPVGEEGTLVAFRAG